MSEHTVIDHTNKKWFWSRLNNENEVAEVCKYLHNNNLVIEIDGDDSGGWNGSGQNVMLEGINLSGNGFCFSGNNLLLHVRYFRKLQEIAKTDDFKSWLAKYPSFDLIKRYIIDKDQRFIDVKKLEDLM